MKAKLAQAFCVLSLPLALVLAAAPASANVQQPQHHKAATKAPTARPQPVTPPPSAKETRSRATWLRPAPTAARRSRIASANGSRVACRSKRRARRRRLPAHAVGSAVTATSLASAPWKSTTCSRSRSVPHILMQRGGATGLPLFIPACAGAILRRD